MGVFRPSTRRRPRLASVVRSRHMTHPRIRGLCHWAGKPAGHLGAESPSRRTSGPASARKPSPPCSHRFHGLFQARSANAMSRCLRALPFASSRRSLTRTLGHSQWPKPPRFVHATAPARWRFKSHRLRAIRPLGRYGGARAILDSPSDVGACHRVVRRHTCFFTGHSAIDSSDTSVRRAWSARCPASPKGQKPHRN